MLTSVLFFPSSLSEPSDESVDAELPLLEDDELNTHRKQDIHVNYRTMRFCNVNNTNALHNSTIAKPKYNRQKKKNTHTTSCTYLQFAGNQTEL